MFSQSDHTGIEMEERMIKFEMDTLTIGPYWN